MGGRACYMRRTTGAKPRKKFPNGLLAIGQNERGATEDRTQENLQPAVTANVIEGCPDDRRSCLTAWFDRGGQARKVMDDRLWRPTRSGGEEDPLGLMRPWNCIFSWSDVRKALHTEADIERIVFGRGSIRHDCVDLGIGDDCR